MVSKLWQINAFAFLCTCLHTRPFQCCIKINPRECQHFSSILFTQLIVNSWSAQLHQHSAKNEKIQKHTLSIVARPDSGSGSACVLSEQGLYTSKGWPKSRLLYLPTKVACRWYKANDRCLITKPSTLPQWLSWSATTQDFDRRGGLFACFSDPAQHHLCATSHTARCCCCSNYITLEIDCEIAGDLLACYEFTCDMQGCWGLCGPVLKLHKHNAYRRVMSHVQGIALSAPNPDHIRWCASHWHWSNFAFLERMYNTHWLDK